MSELERLFEVLPDGLLVVGADGRIVLTNERLQAMTGYRARELVGQPVEMLVPDRLRETHRRDREGYVGAPHARLMAAGRDLSVRRKDGSELPVDVALSPLKLDGDLLVIGAVRDAAERRQAEEALGRRDAILEAVAFAAERFLATRSWEKPIGEVLARLGEAAVVSRAYVFENHVGADGVLLSSQCCEWVAEGVVPQIDDPAMQGFPWLGAGFGRWAERLAAGEVVGGHVREMSPAEREVLGAQDILSILQVPIFVGGSWWGYIGFDECLRERDFSQAEVDALKVSADALGAAIARERAERALRDVEARYRTLVEQVPAIVYLAEFGADGRWLFVSPQIEQTLGYTAEEWMAHPAAMASYVHPDDLERVLSEEAHSRATGEPFRSEYRVRTRDDRWVWVRDEAVVVRDEAGDALFLQGLMYDVTERKLAEQALRDNEESLARAQAIAHLGSWDWDIVTNDLAWSDEIYRIFGLTPQEFGATYEAFLASVHPDDRATVDAAVRATVEGRSPYDIEHRIVLPDGTERVVHERAEVILDEMDRPIRMAGTVQDITERKRAEEELEESIDLLRKVDVERRRLVAHLVNAQEEERARIAADIHDDPLQKITALGMRVGMLKRELEDPKQKERVEEIERTVSLTADSLRHLLFEVRPLALDREGLAAALREYMDQAAAEAGFAFSLEDGLVEEPSPEIRVLCFRIAQEALANVKVHAGASRVEVLLASQEAGVRVRIRDDGVGFAHDTLTAVPGHLGLHDMRERVELAGGWLRIDSSPGAGTSVEFWIPSGDPRE